VTAVTLQPLHRAIDGRETIMPIDDGLYSRSKLYFFQGDRYIRADAETENIDPGYPAPISNWGWPDGFGANGIDAALYSGSRCYFFRGNRYIRVTRGDTGPGTVDRGYPAPIFRWGWPDGFGANGIDAALYSGSRCYFFRGNRYIRVTRGDTGAGTVDPGYPAPISWWGWPDGFGAQGIDAAFYNRSKSFFIRGDRYIRVTRGDIGPGTVDEGFPRLWSSDWS
jgi:Hemopexin